MQKLEANELVKIEGGAVKKSLIIAIVAVGTLLAGIIDGLLRPLKCH